MPFADPPKLAFALDAHGKPKFSGWRRCYELLEEFLWVDRAGLIAPIRVPKGFQSDLATLPLLPFTAGGVVASLILNVVATKYLGDWGEMLADAALVAFVALLVGYLRHDGPWAMAAIVHDALYRSGKDRDVADLAMRKIMVETGVPFIVAWVFWATLRLFGGRAWRKRTLLTATISLLLASAAQAETVILTITGDNCPYCVAHARAMQTAGVRDELRAAKALTVSVHESKLAQSQVDGKREVPIGVNGRTVKVEPFAVRGWPIVLVVDAQGEQGKILRRNDGAMPADKLRAFIRGGVK